LVAAAVVVVELRMFSLRVPSASTRPAMPPLSRAFKAVTDAKAVQIDANDPAKTVQIGAGLIPK
jgi:hypothetical protein